MRSTAVLTSALSLLSLVSARIYGIAAPRTIAIGSDVELIILTENYIQSIQDVAIAFGIQPAKHAFPDELGTLLSRKYLGPDLSNVVHNISAHVHIPSGTPKGKTVLTAALLSLLGAAYSPNVQDFTIKITAGDHTSSDYVSSS